jgi:hypothetical protein
VRLGQHAAFLGDQAAAVRDFDEALASFAQLSDREILILVIARP